MAQWGNKDAANNAPKYTVDATTGKSGIEEYGETVFAHASDDPEPGAGSPGWIRTVKGEGSITGVTVTTGGVDYAVDDIVTIGDDIGTVATVDANGAILTMDIDFSGSLVSELPVVEVTSDEGIGADFLLLTEGRIGRVSVETLVAMRGITS